MGRKVITESFGWTVWSPYQGPFLWSIARTRAEAIKAFQDNAGGLLTTYIEWRDVPTVEADDDRG